MSSVEPVESSDEFTSQINGFDTEGLFTLQELLDAMETMLRAVVVHLE